MAQESLSRQALEMKSGVDNNLQGELVTVEISLQDGLEEDAGKDLGALLGRVESAAASLRYLRSKATILTVPDGSFVSEVTGTSKGQHSSVIEDGVYTWNTLESIQMVTDVLEALVRRVTAAESETSFQKERAIISEEEIRRKTIQIENLSLRLEEMKRIVLGNKTVLDETTEIIEKLVEDNKRDREKALENEEELRRIKTECESLRNYVNTSTSVIYEQQFQTIEDRLVAKSTQLECEKAQKEIEVQKLLVEKTQKEVEVQKLMEENVKLAALLDKKEAQISALNEQCKFMALNASNM